MRYNQPKTDIKELKLFSSLCDTLGGSPVKPEEAPDGPDNEFPPA